MSWGEAVRLTSALASDPSSHVGAALAGWDYPLPHEALQVMNLFDLMHTIAWVQGGKQGRQPEPLPRPWPNRSSKVARPTVSQEVVLEALRMAGHTKPPPLVTS